MRQLILYGLFLLLLAYGCTPVVVGGAAAGAYKTGTDERTVGRMLDDKTITAKVNLALVEDPVVKSYKIDVDTLEGNVILTGVVGTQLEVDQAVRLAAGVEGVRKVVNNLQIGSKSIGQALNDKVIGSKIKAKLIREPNIRSLNIDVDVNKGVVTLTGIVDTETNKDRIIQIARTSSGVVKVIDNIKVTRP